MPAFSNCRLAQSWPFSQSQIGKGRVGVGFPERRAPFGIPEIEIEVIDIGLLASPVHVRVGRLLLSLPRPRFPNRRLLLCHPDEHDAVLSLPAAASRCGRAVSSFFSPCLK